ncbi:cytochrome P450 [Mycena pura]|uniref:Cytochrome P450 n=1 Tax=Mycena pura TaxID=153505 RepID=A0AAD6VHW3_9AGAR|nr:cytochrome P450 [Mycena pura]
MDHPGSIALSFVAAALLSIFYKVFWASRANLLPFPPGPSSLPIIGAFRQLPTKHPWLTYADWGRQYGPLVHACAFGQHIIVVNSLKVATELFEKRSRVYSSRPDVPMLKLMGWDFNIGLIPYGDKWRRYRRMSQQHFHRDASQTHRPIQLKKIHDLLRGLLSSPENFRQHIRTVASAIIMSTVYAYDVKPINDRFVTLAENAVDKLSESIFPGATAVNTFPFLRHLPGWLPGCGFQRFAADCRQMIDQMQQAPFNYVQQNMREDKDSQSITAKILAASEARGHTDLKMIREVTALVYAAGADTTPSALATFFIAMALSPEVQKKAQNEIDAVVGTHRLPDFEDRPKLTYVEAVYREVLRWRPVLPLSVTRETSADDVYEGYFIPKGATVIANTWAMSRDESMYEEPERFMPERYFTADGNLNDDQVAIVFGYGRRICVGRYSAGNTVWATIVSILSTFDIAKAKDAEGNEIDIDPGAYSDGLVSHPDPFQCSITPRSEAARNLIQSTAEDVEL